MSSTLKLQSQGKLPAGILASSFLLFSALSQAAQAIGPPADPHHATTTAVASTQAASHPSPIDRTVTSERAAMMYRRIWGVDNLRLRSTASGSVIRFSYRVVDANKAKVLNDKKFTPVLTDETTGAKFEVPTMEKVGQLRQTATPENGREYWMVFSNKSHMVRPGNHVTVVIGSFRAEGLVVEASVLPRTR
jgi:hypothetical protein